MLWIAALLAVHLVRAATFSTMFLVATMLWPRWWIWDLLSPHHPEEWGPHCQSLMALLRLLLKAGYVTNTVVLKVANLMINAILRMVSGNLAGLWGVPGHLSGRVEQPPPGRSTTSFGVLATTTRISVDASLAGFVIGKGGVHSIQICHQTGVKLSIKEHETNPNLKNIELEGSFERSCWIARDSSVSVKFS